MGRVEKIRNNRRPCFEPGQGRFVLSDESSVGGTMLSAIIAASKQDPPLAILLDEVR
jgi:hypothetical protein